MSTTAPQKLTVTQPTEPPAADDAMADPAPANGLLAKAAARGLVAFYRTRATGTTRNLAYLAEGSPEREVAEWVAEEVDSGRSVADVAKEAGQSTATIRRYLEALDLAEDIESGELDEMWSAEDLRALLADDGSKKASK